MQDLAKHEQFEMEVLENLHRRKILPKLIFIGGTMLRLCYGLDRYSLDLDFWLYKKDDEQKVFNSIQKMVIEDYIVKDIYNKRFTMLFEFKSSKYPRSLKIEIRKKEYKKPVKAIAYTPHSNSQVIVNTISLEAIMDQKVNALLDRAEIRDAYDIEFLIKKGVKINVDSQKASKIIEIIKGFSKNDYKVKLSSILPSDKRKYYMESNFKILIFSLNAQNA